MKFTRLDQTRIDNFDQIRRVKHTCQLLLGAATAAQLGLSALLTSQLSDKEREALNHFDNLVQRAGVGVVSHLVVTGYQSLRHWRKASFNRTSDRRALDLFEKAKSRLPLTQPIELRIADANLFIPQTTVLPPYRRVIVVPTGMLSENFSDEEIVAALTQAAAVHMCEIPVLRCAIIFSSALLKRTASAAAESTRLKSSLLPIFALGAMSLVSVLLMRPLNAADHIAVLATDEDALASFISRSTIALEHRVSTIPGPVGMARRMLAKLGRHSQTRRMRRIRRIPGLSSGQGFEGLPPG